MVSSRIVDLPKVEVADGDLSIPEMMFAAGEKPVGVRVLTYQSSRAINHILNVLDEDEIKFGNLVLHLISRVFENYLVASRLVNFPDSPDSEDDLQIPYALRERLQYTKQRERIREDRIRYCSVRELVLGMTGDAGSELEKALLDQFPEGERYLDFMNSDNTCYRNS